MVLYLVQLPPHFDRVSDQLSQKIETTVEKSVEKTAPKRVFLALKIPEGREPEFYQGLRYKFYIGSHCLYVLTKFRKNTVDGTKVME